eukprot:TRINITY_DN4398_c0_g2_i1.p1 TRINITY_DN4398_c0_g2~~TRINITY_DN4398_c0_g2_i1.p1  ORF type:complete len:769 (+),score=224.24 TRINITY_DN4398_c0_g2_i1:105-2411(+)
MAAVASSWRSSLVPSTIRRPWRVFEEDLEYRLAEPPAATAGDAQPGQEDTEEARRHLENVLADGALKVFQRLPVVKQRSYAEVSIMELAAFVSWCRSQENSTKRARKQDDSDSDADLQEDWDMMDGGDKADWVPEDSRATLALEEDGRWLQLLADGPPRCTPDESIPLGATPMEEVPKGDTTAEKTPKEHAQSTPAEEAQPAEAKASGTASEEEVQGPAKVTEEAPKEEKPDEEVSKDNEEAKPPEATAEAEPAEAMAEAEPAEATAEAEPAEAMAEAELAEAMAEAEPAEAMAEAELAEAMAEAEPAEAMAEAELAGGQADPGNSQAQEAAAQSLSRLFGAGGAASGNRQSLVGDEPAAMDVSESPVPIVRKRGKGRAKAKQPCDPVALAVAAGVDEAEAKKTAAAAAAAALAAESKKPRQKRRKALSSDSEVDDEVVDSEDDEDDAVPLPTRRKAAPSRVPRGHARPSRQFARGRGSNGSARARTSRSCQATPDSVTVSRCCICEKQDKRLEMVSCDGCGKVFHNHCHDPPVIPGNSSDNWYCVHCTELMAREQGLRLRAGDFAWAAMKARSVPWPCVVFRVDFSSRRDPKPYWVQFFDGASQKTGAWLAAHRVLLWEEGPELSSLDKRRREAVRQAEAAGAGGMQSTTPGRRLKSSATSAHTARLRRNNARADSPVSSSARTPERPRRAAFLAASSALSATPTARVQAVQATNSQLKRSQPLDPLEEEALKIQALLAEAQKRQRRLEAKLSTTSPGSQPPKHPHM